MLMTINNFFTFNVNNVSDLVELEVCGQMLNTLLLVATREHVPRATTVSLWVSHLLYLKLEQKVRP